MGLVKVKSTEKVPLRQRENRDSLLGSNEDMKTSLESTIHAHLMQSDVFKYWEGSIEMFEAY